jgi:hypothetical protein
MPINDRRFMLALAVALATTSAASCTVESRSHIDSATADSTSSLAEPAGAPGVNVDANVTPPAAPDSARASSSASSSTAVTFSGAPPLRIGMSEAEARQALGMPKASATSRDECRYLDTKGKSRVYVMLVRDTVARLDVRDSTMATEAGARIGDTESRVLELYRGRVTTQPHKYVSGGHYLVVASPTDSTRRLLFETDGKRVTSFRVGRMPEVQWVEGCS